MILATAGRFSPPIPAWEFEQWLAKRNRGEPRWGTRTVQGYLQLRSLEPLPLPSLAGYEFLDDVDFRGLKVEGPLDFSHSHFAKRLLLRNIEVDGELRLDDVELLGEAPVGDSLISLDLVGARLRGGLRARRITALGLELNASGARIEHQLDLEGARLQRLTGHGVQVDGDFQLNAYVRGRQTFRTNIESIDLEVATIRGDVQLGGVHIDALMLRCVEIDGDFVLGIQETGSKSEVRRAEIRIVDLDDAKIDGGVRITGARIDELRLKAAEVHGEIELNATRFLAKVERAPSAPAPAPLPAEIGKLDMSSANIGSDLWMRGVAIGSLSMNQSNVAGGFHIQGDDSWRAPGDEITTKTTDYVGRERRRRLGFGDDDDPSPLARNGPLRSTFGGIDASFMRAQGPLSIFGIAVDHDLNLEGVAASGIWIEPDGKSEFVPEIGGNLHLSNIQNYPYLNVSALRCRGEIRIVMSKLGLTKFAVAKVGENIMPCACRRLLVTETHVAGTFALTHLQVDGARPDVDRQGVWMDACTIDGDLSFWRKTWIESVAGFDSDEAADRQLHPWDDGAAVIGPVRIRNCIIKGDCELTLLKAQGPIFVEHSQVGGDLLFRSLATLRSVLHDAGALDPLDPQDVVFRAVAPSLSLFMTTVARDTDLTGLTLFDEQQLLWPRFENRAQLDARHFTAQGDLVAFEENSDKHIKGYLRLSGCFDLSSSSAGKFAFTAQSFAPGKLASEKARKAAQLKLANTRFKKVVVADLTRDDDSGLLPMSLADCDVSQWELADKIGSTGAKAYKALLKRDDQFRRSTYLSVEHVLRNQGMVEVADDVYRAMWLSERKQKQKHEQEPERRSAWNVLWYVIWYAIWNVVLFVPRLVLRFVVRFVPRLVWRFGLRFGTDPRPLVAVILFLAVVSIPLYRHPSNIAEVQPPSSSAGVAVNGHKPVALSPSYYAWGYGEALGLLLRKQLPIPNLRLSSDWDLRAAGGIDYDLAALWVDFSGGRLQWCRPSEPERATDFPSQPAQQDCATPHLVAFRLPISPENLSGIISILDYIMWPLLLTFAIRRLLRT